jgi:hypothetical protein
MRHSLTLARGLPCVILAWASISCAQGSAPSLDAVDAARRPTKDATRPDTALPDSSPADSSPADGSPADSTLPDSAPPDSSRVDGSRLDAGRDARAGGPDGAVADGGHGRDSSSGVPDARPDSSGPGSLRYLCPVQFSENCMDGSLCESTCLGQFQYTPTCTWYAMNAVPTPVTCTAVSHLTREREPLRVDLRWSTSGGSNLFHVRDGRRRHECVVHGRDRKGLAPPL